MSIDKVQQICKDTKMKNSTMKILYHLYLNHRNYIFCVDYALNIQMLSHAKNSNDITVKSIALQHNVFKAFIQSDWSFDFVLFTIKSLVLT